MIVKELNMITNKNEAKTVTKHISCDCKCKFISTACNSNQEITVSAKKIIVRILANVFLRIANI